LEEEKEDRKDARIQDQAVAQSKLVSQRRGERGELDNSDVENNSDIMNILLGR
jgi:hypothetical protein